MDPQIPRLSQLCQGLWPVILSTVSNDPSCRESELKLYLKNLSALWNPGMNTIPVMSMGIHFKVHVSLYIYVLLWTCEGNSFTSTIVFLQKWPLHFRWKAFSVPGDSDMFAGSFPFSLHGFTASICKVPSLIHIRVSGASLSS